MCYELPKVHVHSVRTEGNVALVTVSAQVYLESDWEEGEKLGMDPPIEGGDIFIY